MVVTHFMKALIAILILVCVGLGAGLLYRHTTAERKAKEDNDTIVRYESKLNETDKKLAEQSAVNAVLEQKYNTAAKELTETSNTLATVNLTLAKVREEAQTAATNAAADLAKRDARINELETQRDDLTKRMTDLNGQITDYQGRVDEIQRKLVSSEGDRDYLLKELKRLQSEKNDLERQFNDLAMLREQVHKLKDELSITRRLDWIRRGLYGSLKGAERLQKGFVQPATTTTNQNFDLNVELKQSGGVQVVPKQTNAPAPAQPTPNNTTPNAPATK
jgi:DNA repair exonuclease SbcCD ATPase subunit